MHQMPHLPWTFQKESFHATDRSDYDSEIKFFLYRNTIQRVRRQTQTKGEESHLQGRVKKWGPIFSRCDHDFPFSAADENKIFFFCFDRFF